MDFLEAKEEYTSALRQGQKEYKEMLASGKPPHPAVLDDLLDESVANVMQDIGLVEIPAERIVGTRSAGRITTFSPSFLPLAKPNSEFALKWTNLCLAHLEDGIRDAITCYEYLGNFYVEEGNKRVSVLRYFGAPRVSGMVKRILPQRSDDPRIQAYYEFLEFYKNSRLYVVQFRRPGDYAKLLAWLGKELGDPWTEDERRTFSAYFHYFLDAFNSLHVSDKDILPEEALLMWLKIHPYKDLGRLTSTELRKSLAALWPDVVTSTRQTEVKIEAEPVGEVKSGIFSRLITTLPDCVHVAFVHQLDPAISPWVLGHEDGRSYLEGAFGDQVLCRSYYNARTDEDAELLIEQAIDEGAQVIFTTAPKLNRITLKFAVKYPKLHFFNCSVDLPYSSVRAYYGRIFEAKFITGAIAGAMAQDDRIGYVGSNPIVGVPASINAFALGALMTNPRAEIELRWSCCEGTPQKDFFQDGIRVISNRDVPSHDKMYTDFCSYGTYQMDDQGNLMPLASPVWVWGKFYKLIVESALAGTLKDDKANLRAVNYWLGMDSGVIDIALSDQLPEGVTMMAEVLRTCMRNRTLDPFRRKLVAQDGRIISDGFRRLSPDELLRMDWLCHNVIGSIPTFDELLPMSQSIVRELGIYKDQIPAIKEKIT